MKEGFHCMPSYHVCIEIAMLLLLSGDIALNPGPVKYPCTVCNLAVRTNQRALLCDQCGFSMHCSFCGVNKQQYQLYQNEVKFNWICLRCLARGLLFHDCLFLTSPVVLCLISRQALIAAFCLCRPISTNSFL